MKISINSLAIITLIAQHGPVPLEGMPLEIVAAYDEAVNDGYVYSVAGWANLTDAGMLVAVEHVLPKTAPTEATPTEGSTDEAAPERPRWTAVASYHDGNISNVATILFDELDELPEIIENGLDYTTLDQIVITYNLKD